MNVSSLLLKLLTAYGPQFIEFLKPLLLKMLAEFAKRLHDEAATGKLDAGLSHWKEVIQAGASAVHEQLSINILDK
jgi:hypothetical protein